MSLPEVAFLGRSNVGKSALLNRLIHRRAMARVSRTPGRTQEINFFCINDLFVLADLPGYGYARVSKERQAAWRPLIEGYLGNTATLRGAVQLLDVRHDPTNDDLAMLAFLAAIETPTLVAVTKVDKLAKKTAADRVRAIAESLSLDDSQVIAFSAVTGEGRDELAEAVAALVGPAPEPNPPLVSSPSP